MASTAMTVKTRFTATDRMTQVVKRMQTATTTFAKRATTAVHRMNRAFRMLMSPIRRVQRMLGGFGLFLGGALLVTALGSTIGVFKDFEQANAVVASVIATATRPELEALQKDAKRLGATTAKTATEVVGLQEAYGRLGFSVKDILSATEATIAGSIAMRGELSATAELTGAVINSFTKLSATDAPMILDQMTAATQKSALNFEKLQTALPNVAKGADAVGLTFSQTLALLGKLADAGIDASMSSTALRNILLESSGQGLNYNQVLNRIIKNKNRLTASYDEFGKRAAISGLVLSQNIKATSELDKAIRSATNAAGIAAAKQLDTLSGALTILKSAWQGFILSLEDGTGQFAATLKTIIKVATEVLSLASGMAIATDELTDQQKVIRQLAEKTIHYLKIIGKVILALFAMKGILIATNAAIAIMKGATTGLNFVMTTLIGKQWSLNAAMAANPIGLIVAAVVLMVSILTIAIKKYDKFGATIITLLGPAFAILHLIMAIKRHWQAITTAFKSEGILSGLKAIGRMLLDVILYPVQQLLSLISRIPKIGQFVAPAANRLQDIRERIGMPASITEEPLNAEAAQNNKFGQLFKTAVEQNVKIGVEALPGTMASVIEADPSLKLLISSTTGWQGQ